MTQMVRDTYEDEFLNAPTTEPGPTASHSVRNQKGLWVTVTAISLTLVLALLYLLYQQYIHAQNLEKQIKEKSTTVENLENKIRSSAQDLPKLSAENKSLKEANAELQEISQSLALQLANKAGIKVVFKE